MDRAGRTDNRHRVKTDRQTGVDVGPRFTLGRDEATCRAGDIACTCYCAGQLAGTRTRSQKGLDQTGSRQRKRKAPSLYSYLRSCSHQYRPVERRTHVGKSAVAITRTRVLDEPVAGAGASDRENIVLRDDGRQTHQRWGIRIRRNAGLGSQNKLLNRCTVPKPHAWRTLGQSYRTHYWLSSRATCPCLQSPCSLYRYCQSAWS